MSLLTKVVASGYTEGAAVYHSVEQTIPTETAFAIALNSEAYDTDGIHDPDTNNSRLTCKTAGIYIIYGWVATTTTFTQMRDLDIRKNGTQYIAGQRQQPGGAIMMSMQTLTIAKLEVNDYVELIVTQYSGSNKNIYGGFSYKPLFAMQRIG